MDMHHVVTTLNESSLLRGANISASVTAVMLIGAANILMQATSGDISRFENLTLTGALIIAVGVLWRALTVKDAQLVESTKVVTAALSTSAASTAEFRKIIGDSVAAQVRLTESLDLLRDRLEPRVR